MKKKINRKPKYQGGTQVPNNVFTDFLGSFGSSTWDNVRIPRKKDDIPQTIANPVRVGNALSMNQIFNPNYSANANFENILNAPMPTTQAQVTPTNYPITQGMGNAYMNSNSPTVTATTSPETMGNVTTTYGVEQPQTATPYYPINDTRSPLYFEGTPQTTDTENKYTPPIQYFNPYGGVDLQSAATFLGQSIKDKNDLGIVGSSAKLLTGLGRNIVGGLGLGNRENFIQTEYDRRVRQAQIPATQSFQEGGQQGIEAQIVQALQQGADPQQVLQTLIESGMEENQATQLVEGIMQQLQSPQENFMQKGGTIVKELTGEYTTSLNKNDPSVTAEVEHNEYLQDNLGGITKAIGDTHEKGGVHVNLEPGERIVSDHLKVGKENAKHYTDNFGLEVRPKDTYAKVLDKFTAKSGLKALVEEQEDIIKKLKKQEEIVRDNQSATTTVDLNKEFLSTKLAELEEQKTPLEEARKSLMDDVFNRQEASKSDEENTEATYQIGGYHPRTEEQKRQTLKDFLSTARFAGYDGNITGNEKDLNAAVAELQNWSVANQPQSTEQYARAVDITAKGVDLIKANNPEIFAQIGIPADKPSAQYTPEEKNALVSVMKSKGLDTSEFYLNQFADGLIENRFPNAPANYLQTPVYNNILPTAGNIPNQYNPYTEPVNTQEDVVATQGQRDNLNTLLLPNQMPLMPDSLEGALKLTRRYDRIDPLMLTPDQQISELRAQESQAQQQINQLPDSQRTAALANLSAITQQNIAKTIADTNRQNLGSDAQSQQFNAQVQMQEENARGVDLNDYERKILTAKAITDQNTRNYYNQMQAVNLTNYNAVNNVNRLNELYSNFGYGNNGIERLGVMPTFYKEQALASPLVTTDVSKTKKRATKKRFGGKS